MKSEVRRFGNAQTPVVVIDDFSGSLERILDIAEELAPFPRHTNYYPGLRRIFTAADTAANDYVEETCERAAQFIADAFDYDAFDLVEACSRPARIGPTPWSGIPISKRALGRSTSAGRACPSAGAKGQDPASRCLRRLDAKVRRALRGALRSIHKDLGLTSIFVTHDHEEAFTLADRVALLNSGRIEQFAVPEEVARPPANQFVRDFLA